MRFGGLTYEEVRELARHDTALAVIPTGCTEQQGPHLTVDFDTWLVEQICLVAADRAAQRYDVKLLVHPSSFRANARAPQLRLGFYRLTARSPRSRFSINPQISGTPGIPALAHLARLWSAPT
jgi:hypothetical protein